MSVFVLDTNKVPLAPCHEAKARILLDAGKAAIFRMRPFTIIMKRAVENPQVPDLRIKLDPGSKTTGIAVVDDVSGKVVYAAELEHRGQAIKESLDDRRGVRKGRRFRHTRYRQARWRNRRRPKGWLPPSILSRVANTLTWVARLSRLCRITNISLGRVKFDMQIMQNPEIDGVEYQQGTLAGYEVKEYLLLKWEHKCTYCGKEGVPLQIEHIVPRAKGDANRVSNLCLACDKCNKAKGTKDINIVKAVVPAHLKNAGIHVGRMSAKAKGAFTITTSSGTVTDIGSRYCQKLQLADGYGYSFQVGGEKCA